MLDTTPLYDIPSLETPCRLKQKLTIADTCATNHIFPNCLILISYHPSTHICVHLDNSTFSSVLDTDTVIMSLNGK